MKKKGIKHSDIILDVFRMWKNHFRMTIVRHPEPSETKAKDPVMIVRHQWILSKLPSNMGLSERLQRLRMTSETQTTPQSLM